MASTSNHLNNKRRRKSSDHHHHQRQRREGHNKKYNAAAAEEVAADQSPVLSTTTTSPRRTSSSTTNNNRPSWVPTKYDFPWSSHAATYGNCPNVSSRYEKIGRIGEGTYGVVYQARDRQTGDIVALKRCLPHHEASDGFPLTTLREITVLRELQSAGGRRHGIIGLKDVTVSSRYDYVVNSYFISLVGMSVLCVVYPNASPG
mmetsp:Transcript_12936/g.31513  ORF Transcript_12936/g.31513 Transcript_12936/m.31513 type:complete len:203 (-) Transcript_12936:1229-1837(-)